MFRVFILSALVSVGLCIECYTCDSSYSCARARPEHCPSGLQCYTLKESNGELTGAGCTSTCSNLPRANHPYIQCDVCRHDLCNGAARQDNLGREVHVGHEIGAGVQGHHEIGSGVVGGQQLGAGTHHGNQIGSGVQGVAQIGSGVEGHRHHHGIGEGVQARSEIGSGVQGSDHGHHNHKARHARTAGSSHVHHNNEFVDIGHGASPTKSGSMTTLLPALLSVVAARFI